MPSFDSVNYAVRLRKNIERKLIAELLLSLDKTFAISEYQYIGMGSMWFTDFIVMHRMLGIHTMWSIEKFSPKRAELNCPFGFIDVVNGDAKNEVPKLLKDDVRSIVWLDYDHDLRDGIVRDLQEIGLHASCGDVFIVTANAHLGQVKPPSLGNISFLNSTIDQYLGEGLQMGELGQEIPTDRLGPLLKETLTVIAKHHTQQTVSEKNRIFQELTQGVIPGSLTNQQFSDKNFPRLVAQALINALDSACRNSGKSLTFEPIFNFSYQDGAPMVTIGGIAVDENHKNKLRALSLPEKFFFATGKEQISIDVPNLTPQEKIKLDRLLTRDGPDPAASVLSLEIAEEAISNYFRFYKQYPLFSEIF